MLKCNISKSVSRDQGKGAHVTVLLYRRQQKPFQNIKWCLNAIVPFEKKKNKIWAEKLIKK